ncbi:MAG TPA: single-stranded-DNA-specific exonuclease RecJ, partial [Thermomicrobiales bacterium]|nr:single-stranded-DNA-specific exonuclease RecJ [Thermomicrobiales bacterium]
ARVARALRSGEHIGIFGDYDADGITSTAALYRALISVIGDAKVTPFVPNREDGYGVSRRGVHHLADAGCTLMIAVDTGSNDHDAIALAQSLGMDVVILDHHEVEDGEPEGSVLVNPQLHPEGAYTELTGAGVAYLFVLALAREGFPVFHIDADDPSRILDLITLGTVTDVGALQGANRKIVRAGLDVLRRSSRTGIQAMIRHGEFNPDTLTSDRISFGLGPRLNAIGRIADPAAALRLLLTDDIEEANDLAMLLEQANHTRRLRTNDILADVAEKILRLPDWETRPFIALHAPEWESGLVGPIANKIVEKMGVPAIVMQERNGVLSGSGRSVHGVDLLELLREAEPLMTRYGGHAGAGGVTLPAENFEAWNAAILAAIAEKGHTLPQPPVVTLHAWLPEQAWRLDVARVLQQLQPFGHGNAEPIFGIEHARLIRYSTMGREKNHLKLVIGTLGREMEAILWGGAGRSHELTLATHVDLAGTLGINEWQGVERLQMVLKDFHRAD